MAKHDQIALSVQRLRRSDQGRSQLNTALLLTLHFITASVPLPQKRRVRGANEHAGRFYADRELAWITGNKRLASTLVESLARASPSPIVVIMVAIA